MKDPDAIPEALRERDQWLTWDSATDRKQPYWGERKVSWSDPDSWHSFGEAMAKAEQRDSWGVGYVTAANNDDAPMGIISVIDLDGAADADDRPKDWVPSFDLFNDRDAYIEWSQSHERDGESGLHIPVAGSPPEWWNDDEASKGEHVGIDLLANKFCIFTGDQLQGTGEEIPGWDDDIEAWLADAYEALTGETAPPNESGGTFMDPEKAGSHGGTDGEGWVDADTAREALDAISANCGYAKWRNIGFALADHFDERTAKQLFDEWSRGTSKYDREAERLVEDIASRGSGGVTIGTLVHHAQQAGWEPEFGREEYEGTPTARELVARHSDEYDDVGDVPEDVFEADGTDPRSAEANFGDPDEYEPETAETDGGAAAATGGGGGGDGPSQPGDEVDERWSWDAIQTMFREAEDADERATPRFEAAMKLHRDFDMATISQNDQLYVYDPDTGVYDDNGEAVVRSELTQGLEEQYSAHGMNEALDHLRGRTLVDKDEMGGPEGLIAAENCVIDLHEETRREHSPEYRFLSRLGCEFDPDAEAPRFRAFLHEVVPSDTERSKLQEYAGYTLMHWGLPYHKALFLVGPTASGKSTFLDTINAMLGDETVASLTPQQLTSERFSGAELFGSWANIRNDIPAATVENTGMFKEIIAGDQLKAERKRKDPFFFEPTAKHMFAANELPSTETDDEAFYRRILLVPFPETIPTAERDKHLDDKLQSELPGVLNWAIEGLQRLLANGGFTGDRSPGQTQDTWQKWADSVSRFKKAAIASGGDTVVKSKLYAAYLEFCRQEGIPSDTQHSMTRGLKQEGLEDGREYVDGSQERVFMNIELTGRGRQLLDDAQSDGGSSETQERRNTGLSGWD
jgi:putative DNA primase/helicase